MNTDYIRIRLPKNDAISKKLDILMELGRILSVEVTVDKLTVLDLWENRDALIRTLEENFPGIKWEEEKLEDRDWNQSWIEGFQPIQVGSGLWITPPWQQDKVPQGQTRIIVNPGNAFGTGTHESTYLAMKLLRKSLKKDDRVLDLGCGSGILSIAAKLLGASDVRALDNDPDISDNFKENLELNGIDDISLAIGDVLKMDSYECDLALINIQKHVILPLLKRFNIAKGIPNRVILAGLLFEHKKDIRNALTECGYKILKIRRMNEWIAISAVLRSKNEN
jgi:ribosomal protein L11 methyltransferase